MVHKAIAVQTANPFLARKVFSASSGFPQSTFRHLFAINEWSLSQSVARSLDTGQSGVHSSHDR
jgi:hypothetical protein